MTCLDYNDNYADIIMVTNFTEEAFLEIEGKIRNKTCNGLNGELDDPYYGEIWYYDDGNTSLGAVPTASGGGTAPTDPASALVVEG